MSQYGLACEQEKLIRQLAAAKLREASLSKELETTARNYTDEFLKNKTLTKERDAALDELRNLLLACTDDDDRPVKPNDVLLCKGVKRAKDVLADPTASAALAERDRAIERKTAERCKHILFEWHQATLVAREIDRKFNLDPKQEEKPQSRPVCPECECYADTLEGITPGCHCVCHD